MSNAARKLRTIEVWRNGRWKKVRMYELRVGETFRMFEPEGWPFRSNTGQEHLGVKAAPVLRDGVWTVDCAFDCRDIDRAVMSETHW